MNRSISWKITIITLNELTSRKQINFKFLLQFYCKLLTTYGHTDELHYKIITKSVSIMTKVTSQALYKNEYRDKGKEEKIK